MLSVKESKKALNKLFQKNFVADLDLLFHTLKTTSRMSVFRRLKLFDYLSSFTDAGRYYTLQDIPSFDSWGLWFYKDIGFSKAGTLKAAIIEIVHSAKAGMTAKELLNLFKIRLPNTLYNTLGGLVKANLITRHRLEGLCLYTDADPNKLQQQLEERRVQIQREAETFRPISTETTIAVLVEALKTGKVLIPPAKISDRLNARGLFVKSEDVERIFSEYGIKAGKKTMKRP